MSYKRQVVGFYQPFGADSPPFKTVSQNTDAIQVISPTWFRLTDADSSIVENTDPKLAEFAVKHGIKVWPLIANGDFTYASFHPVIAEPARRDKLIERIVELMDSCKNCEGINLDFEGLLAADRDLYNEFLRILSRKLHDKGYKVTIDVPAKTHDDPKASWPGAFDYKAINKYCDYILIMTYDENIPGGDPGPVSSAGWTDRCMTYAASVIPREKIMMGIPFYGYDWAEDRSATGLHYVHAVKRLEETGAKLEWDKEAKTPWFTYTSKDGKKHTAWFENRQSIAAKLEIARKHRLGGVCIWSLGEEDPGIWDEMRKYLKD